jgi:hypothetical protein
MRIETTEERLYALGRAGPNPDGSISLGDALAVGFLRSCGGCGEKLAAWSSSTIWLDEQPHHAECAARKGAIQQLTAEIAAHTAKLGSLTHLLELATQGKQG